MQIQIDPHTLQRAIERGTTENEIVNTLTTGISILAKTGRLGKSKIFLFSAFRNGKYYEEKKVDVYYTIEQQIIITIAVYVFYGKF